MDWLQPTLIFSARSILGLLLAGSLGLLGVGIGWGSYVFFGATSRETLLILLLGGAVVGAAGGGFLGWLRLDYNTPVRLISTAAVLLLGATGGAWGGFQYGAVQEVPCCAKADLTPITYIVLGASLATNVLALALSLTQLALPTLRRQFAVGRFGR